MASIPYYREDNAQIHRIGKIVFFCSEDDFFSDPKRKTFIKQDFTTLECKTHFIRVSVLFSLRRHPSCLLCCVLFWFGLFWCFVLSWVLRKSLLKVPLTKAPKSNEIHYCKLSWWSLSQFKPSVDYNRSTSLQKPSYPMEANIERSVKLIFTPLYLGKKNSKICTK